jgi:hypothetical protein
MILPCVYYQCIPKDAAAAAAAAAAKQQCAVCSRRLDFTTIGTGKYSYHVTGASISE